MELLLRGNILSLKFDIVADANKSRTSTKAVLCACSRFIAAKVRFEFEICVSC
jgi:hypothetical protein